jgi:hypothetical protein
MVSSSDTVHRDAATSVRFNSATLFVFMFLGIAVVAAITIGSFPLQASIATIFLFAGLHNWFEFRYFVGRMPLRWGRSAPFYFVAMGGVLTLAGLYWVAYLGSGNWLWSSAEWRLFAALWNSLLIAWLVSLYCLRKRNSKVSHPWLLYLAIALLITSLTWFAPLYCSLALVFIHPFIAMWFLERQIRRTKKEWLRAYHLCMAAVPLLLLVLALCLSRQPNLPEDSQLFWKISQHAGSELLPSISSHLLVATHVFLETIHYFVWLLLIPLVDRRSIPWRFNEIPLLSNARGLPKLVACMFTLGTFAAVALWIGFAVDYSTTRDIYFAAAILHVLAEFPFLIKML